ncbi:phosphoribosyltransferase [Chitinasiproducens palmae]|uniref:Putative phosphoribosyl transferase n=1 Tax=Chitinasiproducens palmae TaxID=1770053 RepID=A0A1H2PLH8_9BURK|nr:phosphoribosyltransferase family protein [Chitinasiproducens palmae]SDV47296.1 putative phosphoribosyl transferase [Chitinasiproducens palmae]
MYADDTAFPDRRSAGRTLAAALRHRVVGTPVILALPRGGVPVAYEVALALDAPLDLLMVRKIGAPGNAEFGIGAVVDGSSHRRVMNDAAVRAVGPSKAYVEAETQRQLEEIERRRSAYMSDRAPVPVVGRTVIVVDDGIAMGGTARVALQALRAAGVGRLMLAVPVAPRETLALLRPEVDDLVCLQVPDDFGAVGAHYRQFDQTSDEEVVALLAQAQSFGAH